MIRLAVLLPLHLCGLVGFQHSPEFFRLILTFLSVRRVLHRQLPSWSNSPLPVPLVQAPV